MKTIITKESARAIAAAMFDELYPSTCEIVATGEEHAPMMFAKGDIGRASILLAGMPKNVIAHLHAETAAHPGVDCACLVMEGWIYKGQSEAVLRAVMDGQVKVSELPEKGEAVIFSFRIGQHEQFLAFCPIDRATGKLERVELFDANGGEQHAEGRFVGDGKVETQRARRMAN